ncbi:MAG TPA: hypothetical protein VE981_04985 [Planctomycetota bacterium]|nr:hypothetical protein [Planctomycetota bacterium]
MGTRHGALCLLAALVLPACGSSSHPAFIPPMAAGLDTLNGLSDTVQTLAIGSSGTTPAWSSAAGTHTLNLPIASAGAAGILSPADWTAFTGKAAATGEAGYIQNGNAPQGANFNISGNGSIGGALTLTGNAQLIAPRVENAAAPPAGAAAGNIGRLWYDTAGGVLRASDGGQWTRLPVILAYQTAVTGGSLTSTSLTATPCSVTITLPAASDVLIEFGAFAQSNNGPTFANLTLLGPRVDATDPVTAEEATVFSSQGQGGYLGASITNLVKKTLTAGTHTITLVASATETSGNSSVDRLWVKVTRP